MADINVSDTIGLSDAATLQVPILACSVYDLIDITDYSLVNEFLKISVYDDISLTDGVGRTLRSSQFLVLLNDYVAGPSYKGFGQQFPVVKSYEWRTDLVQYDSGREQRNQIWSRPVRRWKINWQAMDEPARNRLIEVFHRARGSYRTFMWRDWDDHRATEIEIATNGSSTEYQLVNVYYQDEWEEWTETKKYIAPDNVFAPNIYHSVDGQQTRVTIYPPGAANQYHLNDDTGILTWGDSYAPSAGILVCTYEFYFKVRFDGDEHVDVMFTRDYWRTEGVTLLEVVA